MQTISIPKFHKACIYLPSPTLKRYFCICKAESIATLLACSNTNQQFLDPSTVCQLWYLCMYQFFTPSKCIMYLLLRTRRIPGLLCLAYGLQEENDVLDMIDLVQINSNFQNAIYVIISRRRLNQVHIVVYLK